MMKKLGFTLAEVLITLGIIGVVAALTAPALVQNAGSAQTGPKLAKAVSTFETANETMLTEKGLTNILSIGSIDGDSVSKSYGDVLTDYIKMSFYEEGDNDYGTSGSKFQIKDFHGDDIKGNANVAAYITNPADSGAKYLTKDGFMYMIFLNPNPVDQVVGSPHKQFRGHVAIDINGTAKPNFVGKDIFAFLLYNDGSLRSVGSTNWREQNQIANTVLEWENGTRDKCNETTVTSGVTCAGSIFENNLKVIYQ